MAGIMSISAKKEAERKSNEEAVAAFLAKGGSVAKCPTRKCNSHVALKGKDVPRRDDIDPKKERREALEKADEYKRIGRQRFLNKHGR